MLRAIPMSSGQSACRPLAMARLQPTRSRAVVRMGGDNRRATAATRARRSSSIGGFAGMEYVEMKPQLQPRAPVSTSTAPSGVRIFGSSDPMAFRVLCYGDSNTIGFCQGGKHYQPYGQTLSEALAAAGTPCEVTAVGLCGSTAQDMIEGMQQEVLPAQVGPSGKGLIYLLEEEGPFDLVIIMAGTNDLGTHKNVEATQVHVSNLHDACHTRGVPTVNLAPPTAVSHSCFRRTRKHLVDLMSAWARKTTNVLLNVDSEELLPRSMSAFWESDELHLSSSGSQEFGRRLAAKVAPILGQEEEAVSQQPSAARAHSMSPFRQRGAAQRPRSCSPSAGLKKAAAPRSHSPHDLDQDPRSRSPHMLQAADESRFKRDEPQAADEFRFTRNPHMPQAADEFRFKRYEVGQAAPQEQENAPSRSPQLLQAADDFRIKRFTFIEAATQEQETAPSNAMKEYMRLAAPMEERPAIGKKTVEERFRKVLPEKVVSEQVTKGIFAQQAKNMQEKFALERAVIALQKMQRKRIGKQENQPQNVAVQSMPQKRVLGHSLTQTQGARRVRKGPVVLATRVR